MKACRWSYLVTRSGFELANERERESEREAYGGG